MATMVKSFAIQGIEGYSVDIETTTIEGQPMLSIIGLGDQAVKEAGERIRAAIYSCSFSFPKKRVIISLAPGDKKKRGSHFDLAMSISLLQNIGEIDVKNLEDVGFIGELSLNGEIRHCNGILPMIIAAADSGIKTVIVLKSNVNEAKLVKNINIYGFNNLNDVIMFLEGKKQVEDVDCEEISVQDNLPETALDFKDVKGQKELITSVIIAAAGGHNMLMLGTPGCGKTMIAQRIPTILPPMTQEEALEVTKIYSICGELREENSMITTRPFRAPHHNASLNALIGGGTNALPGEVSLAHNGVLFLDELTEYTAKTLNALREPLEDKKVSISRVNSNHTFPANFMFVAAMNPCPCGYYPSSKCRCTDYEIIKYRSKISGPIMDRIDIQKEVKGIDYFDIYKEDTSFSSKDLKGIVKRARDIQAKRFKNIKQIICNAQMTTSMLQEYCALDGESLNLLRSRCEELGYSTRVVHKLLRLARTCADLGGSEKIRKKDIELALNCRDLDESNSRMLVV